ncbi:MAG: DUF1499 domain-containing protein [Porticoccaceae bacterium]|nr:DUF1499 domain-containing protein [Porticoccaceae bacterium]
MLKFTASFALIMVIGGVFTLRLGLLPFEVAFYGFGFGLVISSLVTLIATGTVFRRLARKETVGQVLIIALVAAIPLSGVLSTVGIAGFQAPAIHDITTDINDPPVFSFAQAHRKPGENSLEHGGKELIALQTKAYPHIKTIYLPGTQEQGMTAVHTVIDALGWQVLGEDKTQGHIEAADVTPVMGFPDDIVIRVRPLNEGVLIDLRSVSRVGISDLGANAKRIEGFVKELKIHY